jgi:hypothetical protein
MWSVTYSDCCWAIQALTLLSKGLWKQSISEEDSSKQLYAHTLQFKMLVLAFSSSVTFDSIRLKLMFAANAVHSSSLSF